MKEDNEEVKNMNHVMELLSKILQNDANIVLVILLILLGAVSLFEYLSKK